MKTKSLWLTALLLLSLALPALAQDEFVFGMVLVGPKNDRGWSQAHYEGGLYVEENVPNARMLLFESLNPADAPQATLESVVSDMVAAGAKVIFTTSDSFEQDTDAVAEKFPEVIFVNISGSNALAERQADVYSTLEGLAEGEVAPPNVSNIMAEMEWGKLTAGCLAALHTKTGKIGYLGPLINPETRRFAASAYLGARYCYDTFTENDPATLEFNVTWIGFWFNLPGITLDPTVEANTFFDNGVDVVISGIDTTEAIVVSEQRRANGEDVYSIAYDNINGCEEAPTACLGVPYYNWGPAYADFLRAVQEGDTSQKWLWIAPNWDSDGIVGFNLSFDVVGDAQLDGLNQFVNEMISFQSDPENAERFFLWEGPLSLQDGTVLAEAGEFVSPLEVWYLPQLLAGMNGKSN
jgi:simple sugar transport system substrate-binding protein